MKNSESDTAVKLLVVTVTYVVGYLPLSIYYIASSFTFLTAEYEGTVTQQVHVNSRLISVRREKWSNGYRILFSVIYTR